MKTVERIIIISGPDDWVDEVLDKSYVQPAKPFKPSESQCIQEISRKEYAGDSYDLDYATDITFI